MWYSAGDWFPSANFQSGYCWDRPPSRCVTSHRGKTGAYARAPRGFCLQWLHDSPQQTILQCQERPSYMLFRKWWKTFGRLGSASLDGVEGIYTPRTHPPLSAFGLHFWPIGLASPKMKNPGHALEVNSAWPSPRG